MDKKSTVTSRSFAALYFIGALILLSAIAPSSWLGITPKRQQFSPLNLEAITAAPSSIKDTDNDGEISWNEVISGTLGNATETLAVINSEPVDPKIIAQLNDPDNLTGSFSKNIYLATAQLRDKGATDEQTAQAAVNYLIEKEAVKIKLTSYLLSDINIANSESKESTRTYGNTIAPMVKGLISQDIATKDLMSVANYSKNTNDADLLPLVKNRDRVEGIIQKLLTVNVPPSASTYHLLLINRLALYKDTLDNMSKMNTDPVRASIMFNSYERTLLLLLRTPARLSEYFLAQNIVFQSREPGYIFTIGFNYE